MTKDDLDEKLLRHFSSRFKKPATMEFCDYDSDQDDVDVICHAEQLYENSVICSFVAHNRLGMIGDWRDFPAFAGDIAVYCRRDCLTLEYDLLFFFLHISEYGAFDESDLAVLREWVDDVLVPWNRPIERGETFYWPMHALHFLGLYAALDGNVESILCENVARAERVAKPTGLLSALAEEYLLETGAVDEGKVRRHFSIAKSSDNQDLPGYDFIKPSWIESVVSALKCYDGLIAMGAGDD